MERREMDMSIYLSTPLQIDKICRACLSEKGDMRPLFGACLDEMLNSFASIEVHQGDGFPSLMCLQCVLQCSRAYTFKQLCEKSDNILREYLSPEFQQRLAQSVSEQHDEKCEEIEAIDQEEQQQEVVGEETQVITDAREIHLVDEMGNIVVHHDVTEFVTYAEDVKDGEIYTTIECVPNVHDIHITEEPQHQQDAIQIEQVETQEEKHKYPCPKCDMSFNLKVDLKIHLMKHPKDLDYICDICQKGFPEARILRRHLKIHLEEKPHKCDQCDMSFAESSNLSKHKKKHTGELRNIVGKPHLCPSCGRSFKWASSLSKHMKYHTGHKLLSCEYCGKQYVELHPIRLREHPHAHSHRRSTLRLHDVRQVLCGFQHATHPSTDSYWRETIRL
ncbi:unnamed protein product [Acanthoscelides obtectus]|uniref:Uncharacterized protein n=1 Tax=Acanthoscelides obtectus TaxID=200917 RepID=A0A9P0KUM7_ACAOB|nr:unnamed protein product [Acanthoscelides obtectus]CAK1660062.1 Myoneurin [Acanthoscelides obtectus]